MLTILSRASSASCKVHLKNKLKKRSPASPLRSLQHRRWTPPKTCRTTSPHFRKNLSEQASCPRTTTPRAISSSSACSQAMFQSLTQTAPTLNEIMTSGRRLESARDLGSLQSGIGFITINHCKGQHEIRCGPLIFVV